MAIQDTVTTQAGEQTVGTAAVAVNGMSIIMVDGAFTGGGIRLEARNPQGTNYLTDPIWSCDFTSVSPKIGIIRTPDSSVLYNIIAEDIIGTANIYFGP